MKKHVNCRWYLRSLSSCSGSVRSTYSDLNWSWCNTLKAACILPLGVSNRLCLMFWNWKHAQIAEGAVLIIILSNKKFTRIMFLISFYTIEYFSIIVKIGKITWVPLLVLVPAIFIKYLLTKFNYFYYTTTIIIWQISQIFRVWLIKNGVFFSFLFLFLFFPETLINTWESKNEGYTGLTWG